MPSPSLWHNRDYMVWWSGNAVSTLGGSVSAIAFPLLVLVTTGSAGSAGAIGAAVLVSQLATTVFGGALADRVSRKAILVLAPLVQAGALGGCAVIAHRGGGDVAHLLVPAVVSGAASGLLKGTSMPVLRRLVPKEQVAAASAQNMGRDFAAQLVGSPLGGVLFGLRRWVPFAADAVSFLADSAGAAMLRRPLGPDRGKGSEQCPGMLADIADGFRFVRRVPYFRFAIVWCALLNLVAEGFFLLFVAMVRERGGGPAAVGLVNSLALAGGIVGAVAGPLALRRVRARRLLAVAVCFTVAALVPMAFVPRPWQIGVVLLFAMLPMVPMGMVFESYEVRLAPDEYSGRVAALNRFGSQSLQWAGPLGAGLLADAAGVRDAALLATAALGLLAVAVMIPWRSLDVLDVPLADVVPVPVEGAPGGDGAPCAPAFDRPGPALAYDDATTAGVAAQAPAGRQVAP